MKRRIAAASRAGLRGLISLVITMVIASAALFVLMRVIPGDPASVLAGDANATQQSIAQVRHSLGLDQSSFSRMLSLHAAAELHEAQKFKEGLSREVALLGVNAPLRIR